MWNYINKLKIFINARILFKDLKRNIRSILKYVYKINKSI